MQGLLGAGRVCYTEFVRHRYPFDALHWLRHERVDQRAAALAESAARTAEARAAELRAEAVRKHLELQIAEVSRSERGSLEQGELRAGDLQAALDWQQGVEAELRSKSERELAARSVRLSRADAEALARRELGQAGSDAKLIDSHRSSFRAARAAELERAEEEASTEQWTASHFPPRRRG